VKQDTLGRVISFLDRRHWYVADLRSSAHPTTLLAGTDASEGMKTERNKAPTCASSFSVGFSLLLGPDLVLEHSELKVHHD
jgi:hypothetical protein